MKQLYFTSCRTGKSVSGESGFRVRAESAGFPAELRTAVTDAGRYRLPVDGEDLSPAAAPRQLTVVNLPNGQRAALHVAAAEPDPETNRAGNFFLHAVVGPAAEVDAFAVVRSWGSSFWKTRDDDGPTTLPDVPATTALAPGSALTPAGLAGIAKRHQRAIEFLLTAILTTDPKAPLFLAAPPEAVAECVYAILSVLPPAVRGAVTFSTYEKEPLNASSRIVATWWKDAQNQDLDGMCYDGSGVAFNTSSGRTSNLQPAPDYVRAAVQALQAGKVDELRAFHAQAAAQKVADGPTLGLLYRLLYGSAPLTGADLSLPQVLALAEQIVGRPEVVGLLADAATDPAFVRGPFVTYAAALKKNDAARQKLAARLWDDGVQAARNGRLDEAVARWTQPLKALDPNFDYRRNLLAKGLKFRDFPPAVRLALLPDVLEVANPADPAFADGWLSPDPTDLAGVLKVLKTPAQRKTVAHRCVANVQRPQDLPAPAVAALAADPAFAVDVTSEFPQSGGPVLAHLIASEPKKLWADAILARWPALGQNSSAPAMQFLDSALAAAADRQESFDPRRVVTELARHAGNKPVATLPLPETLPRLAKKLLDDHPSGWQADTRLAEFLEGVAASPTLGPKLGDRHRKLIQSRSVLDDFKKSPRFDAPTLAGVAAALQQHSDVDTRATWKKAAGLVSPWMFGERQSARRAAFAPILDAVVRGLIALKAGSEETTLALQSVLTQLGPAYGAGDGVFSILVELFQRADRAGLKSHDRLLYAFLIFAHCDRKYVLNLGFTDKQIDRWSAIVTDYYTGHRAKGNLSRSVIAYIEQPSKLPQLGWSKDQRGKAAPPKRRWFKFRGGEFLLFVIFFALVFSLAWMFSGDFSFQNWVSSIRQSLRR